MDLLDLCVELEQYADEAKPHRDGWHHVMDRSGAGIRLRVIAGEDARTGTTIAQGVAPAHADHIVAAQPHMMLALVAKLREAVRLVDQAAKVIDMFELDWHLSEFRRELNAFGAIEVA